MRGLSSEVFVVVVELVQDEPRARHLVLQVGQLQSLLFVVLDDLVMIQLTLGYNTRARGDELARRQ